MPSIGARIVTGWPSAALVRDWTQAGLLDRPQRQPGGRGRGSAPTLYAANQRKLLQVLLSKRSESGIPSLARIPVWMWMYWGDGYVPLRQVRRAMLTWLGDGKASSKQAGQMARDRVVQLDHPDATRAARRELRKAATDFGRTGEVDPDRLERAAFDVFEPHISQIRRAVGHPDAPMTVESLVGVTKARQLAVALLRSGQVSDQAFYEARHVHIVAYAEYAANQVAYAASAPADHRDMYERVTVQPALNDCRRHLITAIGLQAPHPDRRPEPAASAGPENLRTIPKAARDIIMTHLRQATGPRDRGVRQWRRSSISASRHRATPQLCSGKAAPK